MGRGRKRECAVVLGAGLSLAAVGGCYQGTDASGPLPTGEDGAEDDAGGVDGAGDGDTPDDPPRAGSDPSCADAGPVDVGASPLRRLTRAQYDNTIRDLVGQDLGLGGSFIADEKVASFDSNATASVTELGVEQYMDAAEAVAAAAADDLGSVLPCDPVVVGETECAEAFIAEFGPRAFRRPLMAQQQADLLALYTTAREEAGFDDAVRVLIQAMLQSPFFLYHLEATPEAGEGVTAALPSFEVASRLSYFLWESMPDHTLFEAAAAGELQTVEQVEAQAERMIDAPKASDTLRHFHAQWLGIEELAHASKDPELFPEFNPELADAMREEVGRFAEYVINEDDARFETLMTAPYTVANAELAELYGEAGPVSGFERIDLPADERAGLLTLAGVMAAHSHENQTSPVLRGVMVRNNVLCQVPEPPPDNVDDTPPGLDPELPTKERFEQHRTDPVCAGCHDLIDPLGYGLEHYDAIGRYRTMDGNNPVDATGEVNGTIDGPAQYDGPIELAALLASAEQARQCVSRQWFRYALGRFDAAGDACAVEQIYERFADSDFDIRQLMVAIAVSDSMRHLKTPSLGN